jgi:hypothetical protein
MLEILVEVRVAESRSHQHDVSTEGANLLAANARIAPESWREPEDTHLTTLSAAKFVLRFGVVREGFPKRAIWLER